MNKAEVGSKVTIKVGGKEYETYIDDNGVQRFPQNSVLEYMVTHNKQGKKIDHLDIDDMHTQMLDLNALAIAYHNGKFDKREYAEFNMALGYSVSGFSELNAFQDMAIENPLWEDA